MAISSPSESSMLAEVETLLREAEGEIRSAQNLKELSEIEVRYLGRKGYLTQKLRSLGTLPPEQRPIVGRALNEAKERLQQMLEAEKTFLSQKELQERLERERLDVTLPGRGPAFGRTHILTRTFEDLEDLFISLGFEFVESPEIETYHYNFEVLNYPPDHPALDEQMSFYITDTVLLRTQTTTVQGHIFETRRPPMKIATLGRVYRYEAVDPTHGFTFHQIDGFMVDRGIGMQHLRGTLDAIARGLFGPTVKTRFRPHFFPFVEPGAEMDVSCTLCQGQGCSICGGTGWLELLGCGLIHPNILRQYDIDPQEFSGFAFGMGIDRMPMIRHSIEDMRLFWENDLRFLQQF